MHSRAGRVIAAVIVSLPLALAWLVAPVAPASAADASGRLQTDYTAEPLPTVQVNGVVWDQLVVGDVVYVVGQFTEARPAGAAEGTDETPRSNILAYDLKTGDLIQDFAPELNNAGRSLALSDDGKTLYVGGAFDKVNGEWHGRLAAFDLTKGHGELTSSFAPMFATTVNAIDVSGDVVYAGGAFSAVNGVARSELAAVSASTGSLLDWTASAAGTNSQVYALRVSPDGTKVAVGGSFQTLNGSSNPGYGLALVDASSGAILSTPVDSTVRVAGKYGAIYDLEVDDTGFYGVAYSQSVSQANLEGSFKADWDGNLTWVEPCHGDSYSIYPETNQVYVASHSHSCQTIGGFSDYTWKDADGVTQTRYYRGLAFTNSPDVTISSTGTNGYKDWSGYTSPELLDWYPDLTAGTFTGMYQAAYDITASGDYLLMAGEFTQADGKTQQGLVRFARRTSTTSHAPEGTAKDLGLTTTSYVDGTVNIAYTPTWDRDDSTLTYTLYRDDETDPISTTTSSERRWTLTPKRLQDTDVPDGKHTYRLVVSDPEGNTLEATSTVTVGGTSTLSAYDTRSVQLGASHLWTFDETSGSTFADLLGGADMTVASGVTLGASGARDGSNAATLDGTSNATAQASASDGDIQTFTVETWIKTTSTAGGPILAYKSGTSNDRVVYMDTSGRIRFGVYPGRVKTVYSGTGYNDGQWHQVVGSLGSNGLILYVDGKQVAADTSVTSAQSFSGYWTLGLGGLTGWPGTVWGKTLSGSVDGMTVYPTQLTASQVADHYALSSDVAPTAAFTATASDLSVGLDASGSTDTDGTISSYAWDFGDGSTGDGKTASHTYSKAGTYTVALTVTDDKGATARTTSQVTVTEPVVVNEPPVASYTSEVSGLEADLDASASADPDGSIASYAWDFGDGSTGDGKTASHTYSKAGTYTVTLTVTDDKGATGQSTQDVTVSDPVAANAAPTASFSSSPTDLTVAVDGSASADPDGSIASYAWDFGDGSTGDGKTASHTYSKAGTYTVTLTVTDDKGATGQSTQSVVVSEPAAASSVLASDDFNRQTATGWGQADKGGAWTTVSAKSFSVSGGYGVLGLNTPGWTSTALLNGVSSESTEVDTAYTLTEVPTGGGVYVATALRAASDGSGSYTVRVRTMKDGTNEAFLTVVFGGQETVLTAAKVDGSWTPGDLIHVRFQAVGTSPTTLQAKVWVGDTEPDAWSLSATDSTAALQGAGAVGLRAYLSGSSTSKTGLLKVDELTASSVTQ